MGMTPAEHRTEAGRLLAELQQYSPGSESYHSRVLAAIAHALVTVSYYLEPVPEPKLPGLPPGWHLETRQNEDGERKWGYRLTGPDGLPGTVTRALWGSQEGALAAGITEAKRITRRYDGTSHTGMLAHDGYGMHSHEVRPDHHGVTRHDGQEQRS